MKVLKVIFTISFAVLVTACASTDEQTYNLVNQNDSKRALTNDYALKLSLLNRDIPKDQQMMLAFTRTYQNENNVNNYYNAPSFVPILGPSSTDKKTDETIDIQKVSSYFMNDINSIRIQGPF